MASTTRPDLIKDTRLRLAHAASGDIDRDALIAAAWRLFRNILLIKSPRLSLQRARPYERTLDPHRRAPELPGVHADRKRYSLDLLWWKRLPTARTLAEEATTRGSLTQNAEKAASSRRRTGR